MNFIGADLAFFTPSVERSDAIQVPLPFERSEYISLGITVLNRRWQHTSRYVYRERTEVHEEHEASRSDRPTLFHPHLRGAECCDRPLSCFNRGIEHVQRQLLNTTCPRSPSFPRSLFFYLFRSVSFALPVAFSFSPRLSVSLAIFSTVRFFFLLRFDWERHLGEPSATCSAWVCDSRSLTCRQRDMTRRSIADFDSRTCIMCLVM